LIKKDYNRNITSIYTNRESIENELITYNRDHYKKAFDSPLYRDKIYQ